jgi:hypothetical protein
MADVVEELLGMTLEVVDPVKERKERKEFFARFERNIVGESSPSDSNPDLYSLIHLL